jgi:hypothetical protein
MPNDRTELAKILFRDKLFVNTAIWSDPREAERLHADRLGCIKPNYDVVIAGPDFDPGMVSGLKWSDQAASEFRARGVVKVSTEVQGLA